MPKPTAAEQHAYALAAARLRRVADARATYAVGAPPEIAQPVLDDVQRMRRTAEYLLDPSQLWGWLPSHLWEEFGVEEPENGRRGPKVRSTEPPLEAAARGLVKMIAEVRKRNELMAQVAGVLEEYAGIRRQLASPPPGWFTFGTHSGPEHAGVQVEWWGEDADGLPIWERPKPGLP